MKLLIILLLLVCSSCSLTITIQKPKIESDKKESISPVINDRWNNHYQVSNLKHKPYDI